MLIRLGAERHRNVIYFPSLSLSRPWSLEKGAVFARVVEGIGASCLICGVPANADFSLPALTAPAFSWFIYPLAFRTVDVREVGICCISLALPAVVCFRRERDAG